MDYGRISKRDKHLNMALLQTTLDAVKVGQVEMVAVISRYYMSDRSNAHLVIMVGPA
jgi:hypothetical protein